MASIFGVLSVGISNGLVQCSSSPVDHHENFTSIGNNTDSFLPQISPNSSPQPLLPLLEPSTLTPFVNSTVPQPLGKCKLNFSAAESLMSTTAVDCFQSFAPLLANVICCPQLAATLIILIGQSSKHSNLLALNDTTSKYCLSDIEQTLVGKGADTLVSPLCSVQPSNLTEGSCPVRDVNEFENTVDYSTLLAACQNIDPVRECCEQICQNAISDAATKLSLKHSNVLSIRGSNGLPNHLTRIGDCKNIVLRWLAGKLVSSRARKLLRGLSNCRVNKGAVTYEFVDQLQVTTLEQHVDVFYLACLSDATLDQSTGVSFICDLNDNIPAPWPSSSQASAYSCNKTVKIPALPAAAYAQNEQGVVSIRASLRELRPWRRW